MRQQELWLSVRDRDRLKVLYAIERGHLRQRQGAEQLGVTDRWVRKLLGRVRKEGDAGVMPGFFAPLRMDIVAGGAYIVRLAMCAV